VAEDARPTHDGPPLLLDELGDQLERFRLLRKRDSAATDDVLGDLGAHSQVDRDIVLELSATRPLGRPERFDEAHARRRIKLTVERPVAALWETIGRAGTPPEDQSRAFATYGILLTALSWLLVPAGIVFVLSKF